MAMDMLKRTIELLANSTVSTAKNYFSNADQIVTDSKQIYTGVKDAVKKPVDFVRGMLSRSRGGGIYKLVNDWFYQRSNEFDSFDLGGLDDDDDFDAGFGDNGGDEAEEPSASLDTKAMKDIARGQVGAMYQIGQKQTEASLANTAEIVTTFNSRSSEIVAAITNMTKSIINIDKNLTTLSKAYAQTTAKNQYSYDEESNPFSGGQLTLGKMADALKNTVSDNMYIGLLKMGLEGMKQGGPGFLTDMLVEGLTEKLKIDGKSLRDHSDSLNEKLGNFMHEQFSKLIDLDFVKDWIGDFGYLSRNISGTITNDYTRNKATFDGMTRKTIVEIIPQYLSKITTALTGQIYNIDKKGKLTTKNIDYVKDSMSSSVTRNAFSYDIMSTSVRNGDIKYKNRTTIQINDRLLQQIQQWLTTGYVAYCFSNYGRVLPYSKLLDNEVQRYAIKFAWKSYKRYYGGTGGNANDYDSDGINKEFAEVCSQILGEQLFTNEGKAKFEQGIQSAIDAVRNSGRKLGQEGFDLGSVNDDKLLEWQDSYFRTHSAFKQISDKKKEEIESSMEKSEEYINAKRKLNQGKLPGVLGGGEKKSREVLQLESIKDDVNALSELIKDAKITENGIQRAATTADLFKDGKVSEFGLLRIMIKNAIDAAANDEENLPQSEVRRTLYDNDYKGNIGSLIQDIYKHLTEGVTKVTIVNPPSDAGSGGIPSRLNLNTHGCGPVALSDLATRMNENGMYDPNRGTTVGDYIAAASGMGMDLRPGKATQRALRGASRNHPITVLGSGYGYGTATGQLHYMNIIGSDDNGNLFTSNPMYGNGIFPAGAIANNSVLGLFGSGDDTQLTEEERKVIEEAKSKVSELGSDAKKKLEAMDQESTVTKLLYVLGLRSENIDKATGRIQSGFDKAGSGFHKGKGIINRATDKVNEWIETARGNISEDIRRGIDVEIGNINRRADAIKEGNEYADSKKKAVADDKQISDEDKQLADQALSLMQAALQDGDGTSDLNAIKKVINKIKNNDLRQDLMNNVTGLINRSRQKEEVKPKTKIGKFILFGIGLLKKMFSPVIKGVKLTWRAFTGFLKGAWSGVKKFGKPIMKFLLSPYIRGAAMVSVGAKSLKEGLFGKKTTLDDGTVVKQSGIFGELGKGLFGYREKNADGSTTRHKGLPEKIIRDVFTMTLGQPKALINKLFGQYKEGIVNKLKRAAKDLGEAFGKAGSAIGKFVATTAKWTFKITKFIVTAPFKLIGTITKKLSNFVKKAGPVVKDFFKVGLPNFAYFTKQFISDKWKELKESKFGQGVKKITDKISGTKTFKNVTGTLKAVAGGALDFGKGFAGGWLGTAKDARKKGQDRIDKIFGDKKGGSDAQKTATAIADSNKTNTENLIKSNTEHTKSIMDSFKEGVSSIIEFFRGQKEEEKKEQEEANKKQDEESKKEEGSEESKKQGQNTPVLEEINENQDKQKQRASENNTEQTQNNNNESTTESNNDNNDTSKVSNDQQQSGGEGEGEGDGDKKASPLQRIGGLVGKIFSGVSNIFGGITKIVMTAAMQLSGFKTLVKLVKTIITTAIKPLNKLFKKLVTALKPIIKTLTSALTQMVDAVTEILCTVLETLTPFLEPLFNVVTDIFSAVGQDLISAIGGVLKLLNPLVEGVLTILIPLIKFIHGGIETFIGAIMYIVGQVLYGVGWLVSALPTGNAAGGKLEETGNNIAIQGSDKFFTGIARIVDITAPVRDPSEVITETSQTINNIDNSTVDNSTTTTVTNENGETVTLSPDMQALVDGTTSVSDLIKKRKSDEALENISGSGDSQVSYGSFMNMNKHGCGPIALAENINRRNARIYGSGDIDPRSLTVGMYNAGRYNANRGTSVADYIATGASLGYNMTAGGVNQRSLKQASPTNPITLVGSGTGFGTRSGNNHYINVIGNDGAGFSYVSNPLTGRTSRVATNNLVLNSKLGIYGSGDTKEDFEKRNNYSDYGDLESFLDAMDEKKIEVPIWYKLGYQSEDEYNEREAKMNSVDRQTVEDYYGEDEANEIFKTDDPNERVSKDVVEEKWSKEQAGDKLKGYLDDVREDIEAEVHSKGFIDLDVADRYRKKITLEKVKARFKDYPEVIEEYMKSAGITDESTSSSGRKKSVDIATASLSEVANMDWSAEGIADRYSVSSTVSSLIGGLKDLASNFLSIFNTDDVSTTEGQQKYLAKLRREMGDDAFDKLRAYAFVQFAKEHPPTGVESLEPGTWGGNIYASRFKLYEYEYIKKYKSDFINNPDKFNLTAADLTAAGFNTFSGADAVSTITALLAGADTGGSTLNSSSSDYGSTGYTANGVSYVAKNFTPRLSAPENGNKFYNSSGSGGSVNFPTAASLSSATSISGLNLLANCSGYAMGRFHEEVGNEDSKYFQGKYGSRNGGSFVSTGENQGLEVDKTGKSARPGDVISWKKGTAAGHVAVIEEVNGDDITISHSAYNGFRNYSGTERYFQTKKLKRNANGIPIGWNGYTFAGIVHNPELDYEIANNGTAVEGNYSKINVRDEMQVGLKKFEGERSNLDNGYYHEQAQKAGLTPAQEAYVAGVGIVEGKVPMLSGRADVTLVSRDKYTQEHSGKIYNDFGISSWHSTTKQPGEHDYTYGSTLAEQLKAGMVDNYLSDNPTGDKKYAAKIVNLSKYKDALATVVGHPTTLQQHDRWAPLLETDLAEGTSHGVGNAVVPCEYKSPTGHGKYVGAAVGYWNWMYDKGWIKQKPVASGINYSTDPRFSVSTKPAVNGINYSTDPRFSTSTFNPNSGEPEPNIYRYLVQNKGMTGIGAAGMMGCMKYESNFQSNNLENAFNNKFGVSDTKYTQMVDNGTESKNQFMYGRHATYIKGQTPGEAVGYGLTQFTSSNLKKELYENTVEKGKSISDIGAQLDSTISTLKKSKYNGRSLYDAINTSATPTKANQLFLWRYEAGTGFNSDDAVAKAYSWMGYKGINDRHSAAENFYSKYRGVYGGGDSSQTSSVYIPPIDSNSFLSDALLNQDSAKSVNNYYVAKDSSDEKRQELNILLNHTFNVRSESMEAILTEMLEELRKRGSARQPVAVPSPATTPSLFDNDGIPPQIDRLIT